MLTQPAWTASANRRPRPRSRVNTAVSRPYGEPLAMARASSSLPIAVMGATGPNVSSRATSISSVTPSSTVASWKSPPSGSRRPPRTRDAPRSRASATWRTVFSTVASLFKGPSVVSSSNGSPSRIRFSTAAVSRPTKSSCTSRWTSSRSAAVQLWPALRKQASSVAATAASRSASSSTTSGPLPPISRSTSLPAARSATRCPVAIDPMNPTADVPGFAATSSPTTGPGPVTMLNTPGGRPASTMHSASFTAHTDVVGAGTHTTAFPAARAGATISAGIVYGQFQGVITPTTPRGTRYTRTRFPASTEGGIRPSSRVASAAAMSKYTASSSTSSWASARSGLPWSSVRVRARSSARSRTTAAIRLIAAARSNADRAAHSRHARPAAATARRTSSRLPSGTVPITAPVDGLVASKVASLSDAPHSPSTYMRWSSLTGSSVPGVEGPPVDPLVCVEVERAGVPHGLRILERDLGQLRDLLLGEPQVLERGDAEVVGQAIHLLDGPLGLGPDPHGPSDRGEPLGCRHVVELHHGAQKPSGQGAVRDVVHAAGRLAHGVGGPGRVGAVRHPRQHGPQAHVVAGLEVAGLLERHPEVPGHVVDGLKRHGVGDRLVVLHRVALDRVRQRVHPGPRGDLGREVHRESRVDQGHPRRDLGHASDVELDLAVRVGDHRPEGDLAPGPRRGGHGDQRGNASLHRPATVLEVEDRAAVLGHHSDPLGGVDRASPAQADEAVGPLGAVEAGSPVDQLDGRVGSNLVEHHRVHPRGPKRRDRVVEDPRRGDTPVGHHHRTMHAQPPSLLAQRPDRSDAVHDPGRRLVRPDLVERHDRSCGPRSRPSPRYSTGISRWILDRLMP